MFAAYHDCFCAAQVDRRSRRTTYQYDKASRQTLRIDGKGRRTTYVYDAGGQQTSRQYQDGTRVTLSYDEVGRRTVMWDSTGRTTWTYDAVGQVTSVVNPANKTINYSYYDDGTRKETIEPGGGRFTYTYDDAARMTLIRNPQNDRTTFEYDDADRRTVIRRQNGTRTSLIYDSASQLTNLLHRNSGGTVLSAFTYTYDNAGTRTSVVEPGPTTVTWGYDTAYRLTSEKRQDATAVLYTDTMTYDAVGNRLTLQGAAGTTTFTYDAANQLQTGVLGATRTTYTYDANGNLQVELTGTNRTTNTWDDENRLTKVEFPGVTPVDNVYTFNGDGQRVQIVDSQGTKKPIWDFENILLETDGSNVTQVVYTLEPAGYGNLVSQRRGSTPSYYLCDALRSARKLTNSSGTVTDSYDYKAYGETYGSSGTTTNIFRWIGRLGYYDLDRLSYYLRARPYSPQLARFLAQNPLGSVSSYTFAGRVLVAQFDFSRLNLLQEATESCRSFERYVENNKDRVQNIHQDLKKAFECNVEIFCGKCSGNRRDLGSALFSTQGKRPFICLNARRSFSRTQWEAILLHEAVHIRQFIDANECACPSDPFRGRRVPPLTSPPNNDCDRCKRRETEAHQIEADFFCPNDPAFRAAFVSHGVCESCKAPICREYTQCPPVPICTWPL